MSDERTGAAAGTGMVGTYARTADVLLREVAGEWILVPVSRGLADLQEIYTLNTVGRRIWEDLDGTRPLEAVLANVLDRFEVGPREARADLDGFIEQLLSSRLIERRP